MKSLEPFLSHLGTIRDPRRAEGKLYQLPHVLLFSILAIVTGANSYRGICTFIKTHRRRLNRAFTLGWKRAPAHTAIRYILQGLNPEDVEKVFREHAADLNRSEAPAGMRMAAWLRGLQSTDSSGPSSLRYVAVGGAPVSRQLAAAAW